MKKLTLTLTLLAFTIAGMSQSDDLVAPASRLFEMLGKLKEKAQFKYEDGERTNWNFVPIARKGVSLNELNEGQMEALIVLLRASLSEQGFNKATGVLDLEDILRVVEGRPVGDKYRDPGNYYVSFFGTPAKGKPWGWRFEGHHMSLNFSSITGKVEASTPSFFGSNPAVVPSGEHKGHELLKNETELGLKLVNSLTEEQKKVAIFSATALPEIVSGNSRHADLLEPKGIFYKDLNEEQKKSFMQLLNTYVLNYEFGFSSKLMAKIKNAGFDNLSFAWAGPTVRGEGTYYRIQGPMLLIEYDNTQTKANHVHTAVRDLTSDFADDILKEHYQKEHH